MLVSDRNVPLFTCLCLLVYVLLAPVRCSNASIAMQNVSYCVNVVCVGSPSRIRRVRRISFGITTLPKSSILLTIPVAFKNNSSLYRIVLWQVQGVYMNGL